MRFRLQTIAEGVLLSAPMHVLDVLVEPLPGGGAHRSMTGLINAAMERAGWTTRRVPATTREHDEQRTPCITLTTAWHGEELDRDFVTAVHLMSVGEIVTSLSLRRGATMQLLATVVEQEVDGAWTEVAIADHRDPYRGNHATGWLSGEDPKLILRDRQAMDADDRLAFWMALTREAIGTSHPQHKLFRFAQLWEVIADAAGVTVPVLDKQGEPLRYQNGKDASTTPRAKIWRLVTDIAAVRQVNLPSLMPPGVADTWLGIGAVAGVRDAVAHHGGFNPSDPRQQTQKWFDDVMELLRLYTAAQPGFDPFDELARTAREITLMVLEHHVVQVLNPGPAGAPLRPAGEEGDVVDRASSSMKPSTSSPVE